jgi:hypothetical protein
MDLYEFDVFISHATEDKADFVEPLAKELRRLGLAVWFDKFTLKVGDSLRDSIETGLSRSRYGVVIFSKQFLSKNWPKAELNGLFSREMEGRKIILPVWHNISSSEMKATLPIQADKVALRSSDGVNAVARQIVETVRPELLEVETQKGRVFSSSSALIDIAKSHHPGYSFNLHSGSGGPLAPGTIASVKEGQHRIDISIADRTLIEAEPTLSITFAEEGIRKIGELYRTGKTQSWKAGEFTKIKGTIPMFPSGDVSPFQTLTAGSNLSHLPPKHVRFEVGTTNPTVFPILEMRLTRAGVEEAEAVVRHPSTPLEISFTFSLNRSQRVETSFSWNFVGNSCSACKKVIDAIDKLRKGDSLRLYDIETEKMAFETPASIEELGDDPFPPQLRRIMSIAADSEKRFGVRIMFADQITEQDTESLFYLDCLLTGRQYGTNLSLTMNLTKQGPETVSAHASFLSGQPVSLFLGPSNYPGFFPLFGTEVPAPGWGLYTEQCVVKDGETARAKYDQAPVGEKVHFTVVGETATFVRWRTDCETLLGIAPDGDMKQADSQNE